MEGSEEEVWSGRRRRDKSFLKMVLWVEGMNGRKGNDKMRRRNEWNVVRDGRWWVGAKCNHEAKWQENVMGMDGVNPKRLKSHC